MSASHGRRRALLRSLGALAISGLLSLAGAEAAIRWIAPQPRGFSWLTEDGLQVHIPGRHSVYQRDEFSAAVRFNADGFRGPEIATRKPSGTLRIAALGDSFVEGMQVDEAALVTSRIERALGSDAAPVEVLNLGVSGYGTDDALDVLRSFGPRLAPDLVLLFFCIANDFQNNAFEGRCRRDAAGEVTCADLVRPPRARLAFAHAKSWLSTSSALYQAVQASATAPFWQRIGLRARAPEAPSAPFLETLFAASPLPDDGDAVAITRALLARLRDEAAALGAPLWLVVLPIREQVDDGLWRELAAALPGARRDGPQQLLARIAGELGLPLVDPLAAFRARAAGGSPLFWRVDAHMNPAGPQAAAAEIVSVLRANGLR